MAETRTITFTHKEIVEALIKNQNIHTGIWQIYVEFGVIAGNVQLGPGQFAPAAIVPIGKIGIVTAEKESDMTVDASKVNPP
jgi:hypothetical protein